MGPSVHTCLTFSSYPNSICIFNFVSNRSIAGVPQFLLYPTPTNSKTLQEVANFAPNSCAIGAFPWKHPSSRIVLSQWLAFHYYFNLHPSFLWHFDFKLVNLCLRFRGLAILSLFCQSV